MHGVCHETIAEQQREDQEAAYRGGLALAEGGLHGSFSVAFQAYCRRLNLNCWEAQAHIAAFEEGWLEGGGE